MADKVDEPFIEGEGSVEDKLTQILAAVTTLSGELIETNRDLKKIKTSNTRVKRLAIGLTISFLLDALVTGLFIHNALVLNDVSDKQNSTSCDLYGLFLPSIQNPDPSQVDTPEKRKAFENAAKVILANYATLNCKK